MKRVLSYKSILARILHYGVEEFKDLECDYIEKNCFEGTEEKVDIPCIRGENAENADTIQDFVFKAYIPQKDEKITFVIDIEPQTTDDLKYVLSRRSIYYCARLLTNQYETVFVKSNYNDIQKVYSIWIVTHGKASTRNTMNVYSMQQECIVGNHREEKKDYDLMTAIIAALGDENTENEFLNFLNETFFFRKSKEGCIKNLQDKYGITITPQLREEVTDMITIEDAIRKEERAEGRLEGRSEGRAEEIVQMGLSFGVLKEQILTMLIKKLNVTQEQALVYYERYSV